MVKLPEEPKPVPAGISAMEVSSRDFPGMAKHPECLADDGMLKLDASATRSSFEYFTIRSGTKVSWSVM